MVSDCWTWPALRGSQRCSCHQRQAGPSLRAKRTRPIFDLSQRPAILVRLNARPDEVGRLPRFRRSLSKAQSMAISKSPTMGEAGLSVALFLLAALSLFIAAKAYTPEFAFHAYLFAVAS